MFILFGKVFSSINVVPNKPSLLLPKLQILPSFFNITANSSPPSTLAAFLLPSAPTLNIAINSLFVSFSIALAQVVPTFNPVILPSSSIFAIELSNTS